ncbi:very short patch repair endonuclease [bacterium]|nr:MAG: very short patch repair endonuclease [bacterium]
MRETFVVREATSRSMRANRSRDTAPELRLRKALWAAGLRGYRVARKGLPGRPDIVFGRARLAIFVHGCFWHRCPLCPPRRLPITNRAYWEAKFEGNLARDERQRAELEALGWRVRVVWECQLKKDGVNAIVEAIAALMGRSLPT